MKTRLLIGLLALTLTFSCKEKSENEKKKETVTKEIVSKSANLIQAANYSDENWKNGVGLTYNMILVDYTPEKFKLISKGTELSLISGEIIQYSGFEKQNNFIQIMLGEKKSMDYQASIEYPNEIIVK
jgi:hypothetical protein